MTELELKPSESPPIQLAPLKSRITVVEQVYHQPSNESPSTAFGDGVRFNRELDSDEQPYERRKVAKEEWQKLDLGWVEKCGMLMIRNDEGKFLVIPTPEQKAEAATRVLEISCDGNTPHWYVLPGESMRACPIDAANLSIRCRCGNAKYTVYVIPG